MTVDLQKVFAASFAQDDIEGAKRWYSQWRDVDAQVIPGLEDEGFTCRAMAGHVSDYLEGYTGIEPESYGAGQHTYAATKYGFDIYATPIGYSSVSGRK